MSMWDIASDINPASKYSHWPSPFNGIRNMQVLACQPNMEFLVDLFMPVAANFFFTNFLPSPRELLRRSLLGPYKCGIILQPPKKSPMAIIFGRNTQRVIVGSLAPALTVAYYMWAAGTIWEAASTWTSMIYDIERCEQDQYSGVALNGGGEKVGPGEGAPVGWDPLFDPNNWMNPAHTGWDIPAGGCTASIAWAFQNIGPVPVTVEVWTDLGNKGEGERASASLAPGAEGQAFTTAGGFGPPSAVFGHLNVIGPPDSGVRVRFFCPRFYVNYSESPPYPTTPLLVPQDMGCPRCLKDAFGPDKYET